MLDVLLSTLRSLRAHALRFTLTSLGIVWGAFLLTFLTSAMEGVDGHFTRELEEAGPKLVILWPGSVIKKRVGERGARLVEVEDEDVARLQEIVAVEDAAPDIVLWNQILRANGRTKLSAVNGVGPRSARIRNLVPGEGRFISPLDVERSARVAYLGAVTAERLFGGLPPVGRTIQIESVRFRVIGVNEAKGDQMIGVTGWDDWNAFIPWSTAQRWLTRTEQLGQVVFAPTTRDESWQAIGHVREVMSLHHDFPPDLDTALSFFNVHDVLQIVHTLFFGFRIFLVSAGLITLLVGAVGVMNIMLVIVGERTNEIGLRKAVGAPSRSIFLQFLAESSAVCGLSGLIGALLGAGFTQLVAALSPAEGPFSSAPVLAPFTVTVIVGSLVVVGVVAGVVPAVRAARTPPAEALRAQ
ncbi:MAG: ABC transporter permease [Myxococcota bacterium]|nr:ABC transporter permease [Myxococcota bacterium]